MPNKISLLCKYNPNNDQLSIDASRGLDKLDVNDRDIVTDAVGYVIGGMNNIIGGLAPDGPFKFLTTGQGTIVEFAYEYKNNLKAAKEKYGDEAYRAELTAIGETIVTTSTSYVASTTTGKAVGMLLYATPYGRAAKIAGSVTGGILSSVVYNKYIEKPVDEFFDSLLTPALHSNPSFPELSRVSLGYQNPETGELDVTTANVIQGTSEDKLLVAGKRSTLLRGQSSDDTYYIPDLYSGQEYVIDDSDRDGTVIIGNGSQSIKLSGNALPKTDESGNALEGVWTLNGFDLHTSSSGKGLVICAAGADILSGTTGRVLIQNFPFSNSRGGFGITLGKTKDLLTDASGNVISKIGYDTSIKSLPTQQYFYSRDFAKTSDDKGFFGFVAQASDTPNSLSTYKLQIGNFDYAGNKIGEQEISEFPVTVSSAIYFLKQNFNQIESQQKNYL